MFVEKNIENMIKLTNYLERKIVKGNKYEKLVLVFIIGSMILNGCGAKEESENTLDQNLQIESENISNAETEKSNTESITVEEEKWN